MTDDPDTPEVLSPSERRVVELVVPLRSERPAPPEFAPDVVRTARWQRGVRRSFDVLGVFFGSVTDVISSFVGSSRRHR